MKTYDKYIKHMQNHMQLSKKRSLKKRVPCLFKLQGCPQDVPRRPQDGPLQGFPDGPKDGAKGPYIGFYRFSIGLNMFSIGFYRFSTGFHKFSIGVYWLFYRFL